MTAVSEAFDGHGYHGPMLESLRLSVVEFLLSAMWVFISAMGIVSALFCLPACSGAAPMSQPPPQMMMCPSPTVGVQVSLVTGFAAAACMSMSFAPMQQTKFGGVSGGHFHPAISLASTLRGYLSISRFCFICIGQLLGAIVGAQLVATTIESSCTSAALMLKHSNVSPGSQVFLHFILNFMLVLMHLWNHERFGYMPTPICVGFLYVSATLLTQNLLGGQVINPLRSFGLAAIGVITWDRHWEVWLGSLLASPAAAFVDFVLYGQPWEGALRYASNLDKQELHDESSETADSERGQSM